MKDVSTKVKYHKKYLDYFLLLKELSIIIFFNRKKNLNSVDDRDKILFPSIPKLITIKDLKIGDVLFCNSDKFFSKIIQNSSEGSYCHCALYIGNNRVIDVVPNKLRISNISNFISEYKYIAVTSVPLSASDKEKLSINIEEMLKDDIKYNHIPAFFSVLFEFNYSKKVLDMNNYKFYEKEIDIESKKKYFCSEFVLYSFCNIDYYDITKYCNPSNWTPNGLVREGFFRFKGYLNKENSFSKVSDDDYFLFGFPELVTEKGREYHKKSWTSFYDSFKIIDKGDGKLYLENTLKD